MSSKVRLPYYRYTLFVMLEVELYFGGDNGFFKYPHRENRELKLTSLPDQGAERRLPRVTQSIGQDTFVATLNSLENR